jgi:competence protein ComER
LPLKILKSEFPELEISANLRIAKTCEVVFVCVPPDSYLDVAREIAPALSHDKLFVCISNGVDLKLLGEEVPSRIVKMIPNIGHAVGRGVSLLIKGPRSREADIDLVSGYMKPMSMPVRIDSSESRIASNLTGCGPALLAKFCGLLAAASSRHANLLDDKTLLAMMEETFVATAKLVEGGDSLEDIVARASTGGGMTQAAIETLEERLPETLALLTQRTIDRERNLISKGGRTGPASPITERRNA